MHCSARRLLSTCATPLCEAWATRQIGSTGVVSAPLRSHNESSVARVTHLEECSPTGERNRTTKRSVIIIDAASALRGRPSTQRSSI